MHKNTGGGGFTKILNTALHMYNKISIILTCIYVSIPPETIEKLDGIYEKNLKRYWTDGN